MPEKGALNRRNFIKAATAAACMAGGVIPLAGCDGSSFLTDNRRPNIILITADDLGWKDLPCYGNRDIATPNLDRIAREGVKFTNAFVVASSCAPSSKRPMAFIIVAGPGRLGLCLVGWGE